MICKQVFMNYLERIGMTNYQIFTDGSCRGNGHGGIGIVWLKNGEKVSQFSRGFEKVTNNKMELIAILYALMSIKNPIDFLEIVSDSEYSIGVLTKPWNPKKNIKLIEAIKQAIVSKQQLIKNPIKWTHTKGHQSDDSENTKWNKLADKLATRASDFI